MKIRRRRLKIDSRRFSRKVINFFSDSFFSPVRTVYVVSDNQFEEMKRQQRQEELDNLAASRKSLEEAYQSRIKIIDEREYELQDELRSLFPEVKKNELSNEGNEKCTAKA